MVQDVERVETPKIQQTCWHRQRLGCWHLQVAPDEGLRVWKGCSIVTTYLVPIVMNNQLREWR